LTGADLEDADLRDADLRDANLFRANLEDTNLEDADLTGAILEDTNLDGPMIIEMMNARLIAAAPELLKWLKEMLAEVDAGNCETSETSRWKEAHEVIAKIELRERLNSDQV
jgi:uncharacterized protein YjbI with pentapeptide repeats